MSVTCYTFDAVIVGAGGAGMRAALALAHPNLKVALLSKVFPTRSHTVSAQGGITCALGNAHEDDWRWHMYDTVKGSDYLGDQDSIRYLCEKGPESVYEMEHMGLPFSRMENGKIYQRSFGGQSKNFGGAQASRTCAAADRTGHALLHTLYQQNLKLNTHFFNEWYTLDLVWNNQGELAGVTALCIETGELAFFHSRVVILATGGAGRIYQSSTNALINTGDGLGMVQRSGLPLQDMEMWQFHPTGIVGAGVLMTEGCRGEGGYLVNRHGERFMERYAPQVKDLASRDVVSRAIAKELRAGNGFNPDGVDYVHLKINHLDAEIIKTRLPGIRELAKTFARVDPVVEPIPVVPTAHYMMGGIPTNVHGQVLTLDAQGADKIVPGLFAVGECACVSVHGANRLGGNSLLDLIVFGRAAGLQAKSDLQASQYSLVSVTESQIEASLDQFYQIRTHRPHGERVAQLKHDFNQIMQKYFGVFRTEEDMNIGLEKLKAIETRVQHLSLVDFTKRWNTECIEALELKNLVLVGKASAVSARDRTESRGAHAREDFPHRDDKHWLKHILYFPEGTIAYRGVNLSMFEPKERVY